MSGEPGVTRAHAFADDLFPLVVAHRGASSTHPENTIAAFEEALRLGAPVVEMDVRLTADGVPVVLHDPDVSRTTDGKGAVHALTLDELRRLDAGTGREPQPVPTLREALELLSGRAAVALEIKNLPGEASYETDGESVVRATLAALEQVGFRGPVLVISFNPRSVAFARSASPDVATGLLITDQVAPDDGLAHVVGEGHDLLLPGARGLIVADPAFVDRAHETGVRVGTWTVDDPGTFAAFLERGVDAIATNDPRMGLAVLASNGGAG